MLTSTEVLQLLQEWTDGDRQAGGREDHATLDDASRWNEILGPFFDPDEAARILGGLSQHALAELLRHHQVLGLETADGYRVYPAFQFDSRSNGDRRCVLAGLPQVLETLASSGIDEWSLAGWLMSAMKSLDGRTPVEWLRSGRDPSRLMSIAHAAAQRFAQ